MRKPTLKDISQVQYLLNDAKDKPVGTELAQQLKDIEPECYNKAMILAHEFLVNPTIGKTKNGKETILVYTKFKDSGKIHESPSDIDELYSQYRWDMVCQIWNQLNMSTDEIENL